MRRRRSITVTGMASSIELWSAQLLTYLQVCATNICGRSSNSHEVATALDAAV